MSIDNSVHTVQKTFATRAFSAAEKTKLAFVPDDTVAALAQKASAAALTSLSVRVTRLERPSVLSGGNREAPRPDTPSAVHFVGWVVPYSMQPHDTITLLAPPRPEISASSTDDTITLAIEHVPGVDVVRLYKAASPVGREPTVDFSEVAYDDLLDADSGTRRLLSVARDPEAMTYLRLAFVALPDKSDALAGFQERASFSEEIVVSALGTSPIVLAPPTDVVVSAGSGFVQLAFSPNPSADLTETEIHVTRSDEPGSSVLLDTVVKHDGTFVHKGLPYGVTFTYRLVTRSATGDRGTFSEPVTVTLSPPPTEP